MPFIGPWEIALILAIVLIIFGPKKLPQLAKSIGDAIKQYRDASEGRGPITTSTPQPTSIKSEGNVLIETAKKLGISTEGKTMEEISKEIEEMANKPSKSKTVSKKTSSKRTSSKAK